MPKSVIEAIRQGIRDYEPAPADKTGFESTSALPGTEGKLQVLAERIAAGLPLWHESDRLAYDEDLES